MAWEVSWVESQLPGDLEHQEPRPTGGEIWPKTEHVPQRVVDVG